MSFMIFQSRRKPLDLDALTLPDGRQARSDSDPCGAICPLLLPGTVNGDEGLEISSVDAHIKQQIHTVQFGINYRFGWGKGKAPVVARY
jgi:hypothetical protein